MTPASFAGATPADCTTATRRITELSIGAWYDLYKGDLGRLRVGAQYEYLRRDLFAGIGGAPATDNNIILSSLRYYLPEKTF